MSAGWTQVTRGCPFPECEWTCDLYEDETGMVVDDYPLVEHYEREHAGRVRVQVTIEYEQLLSGRSAKEVREMALERWEEKGHDVAHVRTEVLEESDDHSQLGGTSEDG